MARELVAGSFKEPPVRVHTYPQRGAFMAIGASGNGCWTDPGGSVLWYSLDDARTVLDAHGYQLVEEDMSVWKKDEEGNRMAAFRRAGSQRPAMPTFNDSAKEGESHGNTQPGGAPESSADQRDITEVRMNPATPPPQAPRVQMDEPAREPNDGDPETPVPADLHEPYTGRLPGTPPGLTDEERDRILAQGGDPAEFARQMSQGDIPGKPDDAGGTPPVTDPATGEVAPMPAPLPDNAEQTGDEPGKPRPQDSGDAEQAAREAAERQDRNNNPEEPIAEQSEEVRNAEHARATGELPVPPPPPPTGAPAPKPGEKPAPAKATPQPVKKGKK